MIVDLAVVSENAILSVDHWLPTRRPDTENREPYVTYDKPTIAAQVATRVVRAAVPNRVNRVIKPRGKRGSPRPRGADQPAHASRSDFGNAR